MSRSQNLAIFHWPLLNFEIYVCFYCWEYNDSQLCLNSFSSATAHLSFEIKCWEYFFLNTANVLFLGETIEILLRIMVSSKENVSINSWRKKVEIELKNVWVLITSHWIQADKFDLGDELLSIFFSQHCNCMAPWKNYWDLIENHDIINQKQT